MTARLVVLAGPTASGKSALALELAERLDAEIVNADSQQVYRGLDIGTGKPTAADFARVPHHLYDLADPWEQLDAARFLAEADRVLAQLAARGRSAIVVGGTGLWIRALLKGLVDAPGQDPAFRERLRNEAETVGWPALHARLAQVDPESAARIHATDPVRIERALEVFTRTGEPLSALYRRHREQPPRYQALQLGLEPPRELLEHRIRTRARAMFDEGLLEETERVAQEPRAVEKLERVMGYREALACLRGELSREEAFEATATAQRQYAKRQRTWFRGEPEWQWLDSAQAVDAALRACKAAPPLVPRVRPDDAR